MKGWMGHYEENLPLLLGEGPRASRWRGCRPLDDEEGKEVREGQAGLYEEKLHLDVPDYGSASRFERVRAGGPSVQHQTINVKKPSARTIKPKNGH